jgi:hypothetical protein
MEDLGKKTRRHLPRNGRLLPWNGRVARPFLKMEGPGISQRSNSTLECAIQIHYLEFVLSLSLSLSHIHTYIPTYGIIGKNQWLFWGEIS